MAERETTMRFKKLTQFFTAFILVLAMSVTAVQVQAMDGDSNPNSDPYGRAGIFGISGDLGYYTYGMNDVNNRLNNSGGGSINGGLGYGAALKFGLTNALTAKIGLDYLFAGTASSRTIGGTTYNSQVEIPATMLFIGGEYVFLPLEIVNLKLIGGYELVSIYNGDQKSNNGMDLGSVTGSGSGAQFGAGLEVNLSRGFSLEADLCYNFATIYGATFAGPPSQANSPSSNGTVDYSGLVAKVAFNIYLFR
jgi:hypothetical protein